MARQLGSRNTRSTRNAASNNSDDSWKADFWLNFQIQLADGTTYKLVGAPLKADKNSIERDLIDYLDVDEPGMTIQERREAIQRKVQKLIAKRLVVTANPGKPGEKASLDLDDLDDEEDDDVPFDKAQAA